MESIAQIPRPIGSGPISQPSHHRPLQRVKVAPNTVPHTSELAAAHPLLFTQSSALIQKNSDNSTSSSDASNGDSCYSSCSEESHASLSRESSDSATRDYGAEPLKIDVGMLEFATKLGYSESSLRIVLDKLGPDAGQNNVLQELIQLGKNGPEASRSRGHSAGATTVQQYEQQLQADGAQPKLRPIVIDGSNVAISHGHKEFFSCKGIRECVSFFLSRGHQEIFVFVPQFRRENSRADCPITDQHILLELENEKRLIWTPARRIGGRRIVCHDDRYILKTAEAKDAVIVSNDEYRDLIKEHPQYRAMVEQRLLMFSFIDGQFMPPDDPLGRRGPSLDQFLSFAPSATTAQLCPYAKKCTYGNKCKYYHPERKNGVRQTVTDRLTHRKQNLKERPSMIYEGVVLHNRNNQGQGHMQSLSVNNRNQVGRTQSLNVPLGYQPLQQQQQFNPMCYQNNAFQTGHQPHPVSQQSMNMSALWGPLQPQPQQQQHSPLNRNYSSPMRGAYDAQPSYRPLMHLDDHPASRSNSLGDFAGFDQQQSRNNLFDPMFPLAAPSGGASVWGETMFPLSSQPANPALNPNSDDLRLKVQYHLCQLFPESTVLAVMGAHPDERDAQKLCQMIIAFQKGFENNQ